MGRGCREDTLVSRFYAKVKEGSPDECWPWTAGLFSTGYGCIRRGEEMVPAHRVAWELANGRSIPDGMCICHHCDNKVCCNPRHLFLGTYLENTQDMVSKGRQCYNALTEEQARDIKFSKLSRQELAEKHNRPIATINGIVYGYKWKHLQPPASEIENEQVDRPDRPYEKAG